MIAQTRNTSRKLLKEGAEVMVLSLGQPVPKGSKLLNSIEIDRETLFFGCTYNGEISNAKDQARKAGGNVVKITELKNPNLSTYCYRMKADIFFNDSVKAVDSLSKLIRDANVIKTQQKNTDSTFSRFKIMVNPSLMVGQKEFGGMVEYRLQKSIAVEVGGGANLNYTYAGERSHLGKKLVAGNGLTVRAGIKFYSNSRIYINPEFFYRNMLYHKRYYEWGIGSSESSKQDEPGIMAYGCSCDGDSQHSQIIGEVVDEKKQIIAFETLLGKEFIAGNFAVDIYCGIGLRYKYKVKKILSDTYYESSNGGYYFGGTTYYSPPQNEKISAYVPTIHVGFQIGFLSKPITVKK
jgi:hypothetical protein